MQPDSRGAVVARLLATHGQVVTSQLLMRAGLTPKDLHRLTANGRLVRLRRGVLVDGQSWRECPPWERHQVRARAFALSLMPTGEEPLALSHHSALALLGLSVHGVDDDVHLCRTRPGKCYRSTGLHVHGAVDSARTVVVDGVRVVNPALACLQVAAASGVEAGLIAADSALHTDACSSADLEAELHSPLLQTGRPSARLVAEHADGRRESAGESRSAWLLHQLPVPRAVPQVIIQDRHGLVVARVDFLLEGTTVVVEFDGMVKYAGIQDIHAEKRREDTLRELGYEVVRLTWDDLDHPDRVLTKIRAALERAGRRVAS